MGPVHGETGKDLWKRGGDIGQQATAHGPQSQNVPNTTHHLPICRFFGTDAKTWNILKVCLRSFQISTPCVLYLIEVTKQNSLFKVETSKAKLGFAVIKTQHSVSTNRGHRPFSFSQIIHQIPNFLWNIKQLYYVCIGFDAFVCLSLRNNINQVSRPDFTALV